MNVAQTKLGRFVSKISEAQGAVIGLGVYGFGRMISAALEAGSALHDLSQKLGISTEALSALDYATKQLGGSTDSLHNALAFMSKTLGDAAAGATAAQAAFQRLGLDFGAMIQLSPEQQFLTLVEAINKLPSAAEKASAAQDIFGRGAKDLAAVINAGTTEIIKMGDAAASTGAIIGTDAAAALDAAADSVTSFKDSWSSLWTQGVAVFAPLITGAMVGIDAILRSLRAIWGTFQFAVVGGIELMARGFLELAEAANVLLPTFAQFDPEPIKSAISSFAAKRGEIVTRLDVIGGKGSAGNPLANPAKMDELIDATRANQGTVQLATASVR